jgi:hypothetical protein
MVDNFAFLPSNAITSLIPKPISSPDDTAGSRATQAAAAAAPAPSEKAGAAPVDEEVVLATPKKEQDTKGLRILPVVGGGEPM